MKTSAFLPAASLALLLALPASAAWELSTEGVPSGCTHVITDGNWKIGVYRYSDHEPSNHVTFESPSKARMCVATRSRK